MSGDSVRYFSVLNRLLEFVQTKVDQRLTDKTMLAFSYLIAAGGMCPQSEVTDYIMRINSVLGDGSKSGAHYVITKLESTYLVRNKVCKGLGLIISTQDPQYGSKNELRLSPKGQEAADAIASMFRSALTRVKT